MQLRNGPVEGTVHWARLAVAIGVADHIELRLRVLEFMGRCENVGVIHAVFTCGHQVPFTSSTPCIRMSWNDRLSGNHRTILHWLTYPGSCRTCHPDFGRLAARLAALLESVART